MDATTLISNLDSTSVESSLTRLLKIKDRSTDEHSHRVAELTSEWMIYMKSRNQWLDLDEVDLVLAARLHDVGKIGVRGEILNKAGPLTLAEKNHLNEHSDLGYHLLCMSEVDEKLALAVKHHHERWDGTGYPNQLKRDEIPFFAQVIAVVDTYDAITSDRPYRKARGVKDAIQEIENAAGGQFSPVLVASFVKFLIARNV